MKHELSFVSAIPDATAFENLMLEYYQVMVAKLTKVGGPGASSKELAQETMGNIEKLLPPNGRTLLAHDEDGALVGCGVIRKIGPDAAELKRMYVRPIAQGNGLGRKLFEMRVEEAQEMGCTKLFADTVTGNRAMLSMYEKFGFSYIDRYPENANGPELEPYLVYLRRDLPAREA